MKTTHRIGVIGLLGFLGWAAVPALADEPLTVEQVVARCAEAMGGAEKIAAVKTLRFKIAYADRPLSVITEIKRPNRIRSEAHYVLVFDGKRAGYLKGAPSADGKDPGPRLLPVEEGKDFEVDIAFLFPAFFDYPAEYMGLETVEGKKSHQVGVVLPMGIRMTYFLDAKTLLPTKIVADLPHQGKVYRPEHAVGEYERTDGILFPRISTATGWGPRGRAIIESVEVNIPLGDDRFEMPGGPPEGSPEALG